MTHPANGLDELVHQRARLGILAVLTEAKEADFAHLRRTLELTDGNLSRHLQVLEDAGLVKVRKGYVGRRPRTWASVTRAGRAAFADEISALRRLIEHLDEAAAQPREQAAGEAGAGSSDLGEPGTGGGGPSPG